MQLLKVSVSFMDLADSTSPRKSRSAIAWAGFAALLQECELCWTETPFAKRWVTWTLSESMMLITLETCFAFPSWIVLPSVKHSATVTGQREASAIFSAIVLLSVYNWTVLNAIFYFKNNIGRKACSLHGQKELGDYFYLVLILFLFNCTSQLRTNHLWLPNCNYPSSLNQWTRTVLGQDIKGDFAPGS